MTSSIERRIWRSRRKWWKQLFATFVMCCLKLDQLTPRSRTTFLGLMTLLPTGKQRSEPEILLYTAYTGGEAYVSKANKYENIVVPEQHRHLVRWRCCSGTTIFSYLFARWHLFRHVGYLRHQQQVDLWHFDFESGVRVTCDVGTSVPILVS